MFFLSGVEVVDVVIQVLEHQVEFVADVQHLLQFDDAGVGEFPQGFHLPKLNTLLPIGVGLLELFDGHYLAGCYVRCLVHDTEVTFSECLQNLVLLHLEFITLGCCFATVET